MRLGLGLVIAILLLLLPGNDRGWAQHAVTDAESHPLAGWWLAVDRFWPLLRDEAGAATFEELLVVHDDGTTENRAVFFQLPGEEACSPHSEVTCSDAPLIASAMTEFDGITLAFTGRRDGTAPLFGGDAELDQRMRGLAITGAGAWTVTAHLNGRRISLLSADGRPARNLVRISPTLLQRLRAGIMVASISVHDHWRCYLERALDGADVTSERLAVELVGNYLHVASYALALFAASRPDATLYADSSRNWLMIETFDLEVARSEAERGELEARLARLMSGNGSSDGLPFTAAELDDFATIVSHGAATRRLFCLY